MKTVLRIVKNTMKEFFSPEKLADVVITTILLTVFVWILRIAARDTGIEMSWSAGVSWWMVLIMGKAVVRQGDGHDRN